MSSKIRMCLPSFTVLEVLPANSGSEVLSNAFEQVRPFAFSRRSKPIVPVFRELIQFAATSEKIGDLTAHLGNLRTQ
jgi:hypothetical protein